MKQFEKEYREAMPQTIGETDRQFDDHNYTEFLERWVVKLLATPAVSKCEGIEREISVCDCKHSHYHIEEMAVFVCTDCGELLGKQTDC